MWRTGYDGRRWNQKITSTTRNHCCQKISIRYSLYVLTIKGQNILKKINIWYLKKETRPYIPNPQRCFQCQKFGHTENSCKGKAVCAGCGEEGHNLDDCQNEPKCVNCQSNHVAISRDCPKWKIEKDIVTLKYTGNISFADARTRLQPSFDPSKDSYATVTQTPPQSSRPLLPWARKSDFQLTLRRRLSICNIFWITAWHDWIIRWNHFRRSSSSRCTFLRWNTPSTTNYSRTNKWNHNPEYWVRSTICSFKWCQQRWKWNRNAYNEQ